MAERLDPDLAVVVSAVPEWNGLDISATVLSLGITNRNYKVEIGGEAFVVRLPGRDTELLGIDRATERDAAQAAAAAGVAPEVFGYVAERRALITRFVEADPLPPEDLERDEVLDAVVTSMKAIHAMPLLRSTFDAFDVVREYRRTASDRGVSIPDAYEEALGAADAIRAAFETAPMPACSCHNDLLNANLLMRGGQVVIVDYDYAGVGDRFFDLGNIAINNGMSQEAQRRLLEKYFGEVRPVHVARQALMRVMSDFREAMWGVVQQGISDLDFDYVEYANGHFARCLGSIEDPRFGDWVRDAADAV
jgi:thiamine kinase-like enzyme